MAEKQNISARKAIDSDPWSFWNAPAGSHWNYTFAKQKALRRVKVSFEYHNFIKDVSIHGKLSFRHNQWKELKRLNGNPSSPDLTVDVSNTNDEQLEFYQAVGISINAVDGAWVGLSHVEFFESKCNL